MLLPLLVSLWGKVFGTTPPPGPVPPLTFPAGWQPQNLVYPDVPYPYGFTPGLPIIQPGTSALPTMNAGASELPNITPGSGTLPGPREDA